jgi:hypothetical protein
MMGHLFGKMKATERIRRAFCSLLADKEARATILGTLAELQVQTLAGIDVTIQARLSSRLPCAHREECSSTTLPLGGGALPLLVSVVATFAGLA